MFKHIFTFIKAVAVLVHILIGLCFIVSAYSYVFDPRLCWGLPSSGLLFPVFLLLEICFFIFWLVVKKRNMWISVVAVLLCYGPVRTFFPLHLWGDKTPLGAIKILSYNVMGCGAGIRDTTEYKNPVLKYIIESGADIVCMQEFHFWGGSKRLSFSEADTILKKKYPYASITDIKGGNTLACYSKFPILETFPIKMYTKMQNGAVGYRIACEKEIIVINNHLESNRITYADKVVYTEVLHGVADRDKVKEVVKRLGIKVSEASKIRAEQADSIAEIISGLEGERIIVCGDFNDISLSYSYRKIRGKFRDAFVDTGLGCGISFNRDYFWVKIDHILYGNGFKAYNCNVDKKIDFSDHYPIYSSFVLL